MISFKCKGYGPEDFVKMFSDKGYEVLDFYRTGSKKSKIFAKYICSKHKERGIKTMDCFLFLKGRQCKACSAKKGVPPTRLTQEEAMSRIDEKIKNEYDFPSTYTLANDVIPVKHKACGRVRNMRWNDLFCGYRCSYCLGMHRNTEDFKKIIYEMWGDEYIVIGEYTNNMSKIKMKHMVCGKEYDAVPNRIVSRSSGCPFCCGKNTSGFSLEIETFLYQYGVEYTREYRFDDCRNILPLPFDFAVHDDKNNLFCLIEADGSQHGEDRNAFGGYGGSEIAQKRDKIKNEYCKKNNIKLVRIDYVKKGNVANFLEKKLKKLIKNKTKSEDVNARLYLQQDRFFGEEKVLNVRKEYATGQTTIKKLAQKYEKGRDFIHGILKYEFMPHIAPEYKQVIDKKRNSNKRTTKGTVKWADEKTQNEIVELYDTGLYNIHVLAKKYKAHYESIKRVLKKYNRKILRIYNKKGANDVLSGASEIKAQTPKPKEKEKEVDLF